MDEGEGVDGGSPRGGGSGAGGAVDGVCVGYVEC